MNAPAQDARGAPEHDLRIAELDRRMARDEPVARAVGVETELAGIRIGGGRASRCDGLVPAEHLVRGRGT